MPSSRNRDLSFTILHQLPPAARDTYQKAYQKARVMYGARGAKPDLDEIAHGVALASLEASYHRTERGRWVAD